MCVQVSIRQSVGGYNVDSAHMAGLTGKVQQVDPFHGAGNSCLLRQESPPAPIWAEGR